MPKTHHFFNWLKENIAVSLPGLTSQIKLSPKLNGKGFRSFTPAESSRSSAVMLLFTEVDGNIRILFTLRSSTLNSHKGQISFPGGMNEQGESLLRTALRETEEEIGIKLDEMQIAGAMSDLFVPPSDTVIKPFVAYLPEGSEFQLNESEVEEIIFKEADFFLDEGNLTEEYWDFKGSKILVPFWKIHDKTPLWGATSMILSEFLDLYRKYLNLEEAL